MARKQNLAAAPAVETYTDYKLARLASEWSRLEDERLDLQAQARTRGERQGEIETEFKQQLDARGLDLFDLPKFQIGWETRPGSVFYKGKLREVLGDEKFDALLASVPPKRDLFVRVKEPAPKRAAKAAKSPPARRSA